MITSPAAAASPVTPPTASFELRFNPVAPWFGHGPATSRVDASGSTVPFASYTNTQNPNFMRPGTQWVHSENRRPDFSPIANSFADRLTSAANALKGVPSDPAETGYTRNGRFELRLAGVGTWTGSLNGDGRGPVRDAIDSIRALAADMVSEFPGEPNAV